jgi:uncharacterized RDD family membrane protein YckC
VFILCPTSFISRAFRKDAELSDKQASELFKEADADGDGKITPEEFTAVLQSHISSDVWQHAGARVVASAVAGEEPGVTFTEAEAAGRFRRVIAALIDIVICSAGTIFAQFAGIVGAVGVFSLKGGIIALMATFFLPVLVFTFGNSILTTLLGGSSFGKLLMDLRIVRKDGKPLGFMMILFRQILTFILNGFDLLFKFFTKSGLVDRVLSLEVVDRKAVYNEGERLWGLFESFTPKQGVRSTPKQRARMHQARKEAEKVALLDRRFQSKDQAAQEAHEAREAEGALPTAPPVSELTASRAELEALRSSATALAAKLAAQLAQVTTLEKRIAAAKL